ncbi:MAG: D-sedoheptulose 7-phosphate isomerase [Lachnospiraceae bacterium]|nr:D-sedoheptulose 7-phosphate isomerase [Lachnospiraceae bacterium]
MSSLIRQRLQESIKAKEALLADEALIQRISEVAEVMAESLKRGGKLLLCGNGGSASDALHFAGEIVGRFQMERSSWPAVVLNADVASMTAVANDYGYDEVFARQVQAFMKPEDVLVGISTSGNSRNVLRAIEATRTTGGCTVALLGKDGGAIKDMVDYSIVVPNECTARVQECHITIIHILCELIELKMQEG